MRGLSLFSGIGGLDLAADWAGIETALFCEIEPYACEILKRRWPDVLNLRDIRYFSERPLRELGGSPYVKFKVPAEYRGTVDVVHGGFPCQDLSVAGKQAGLSGERSGLWFEMLRVIAGVKPRFVVAENVRGAVNLALDTVCSGLGDEGYEVRPYVLPASAFGAPHQRERLFVLGVRADVADSLRSRGEAWVPGQEQGEEGEPAIPIDGGSPSGSLWPTPRGGETGVGMCGGTGHWEMLKNGVGLEMAQKMGGRGGGQLNPAWVECMMGYPLGWTDVDCDEPEPWPGWPALMGQDQYPYEPPRTVTGCKNRAKRLKCLGNSVVPQQAYPIFRAIAEIGGDEP